MGTSPKAEQHLCGTVAQRFTLLGLAGSGGMGTVYLAQDDTSGQRVAIKLLHDHSTQAERDRFAREARVLAGLSHPGIVAYIDHGVTETGQPYLAMEWLDGEDLSQRLRRQLLSVPETLELARRLSAALSVAHQRGVVHRDIKPSKAASKRAVRTHVPSGP